MASEAYFEALVATAKGFEKLRRWRMGQERKSFFNSSKDCWQVEVQSQQVSFLVRSRRGWATVE